MTINCLNGSIWGKYFPGSSCFVSSVSVIYSPKLLQNRLSSPVPFPGIYFQHGSWNETVWTSILSLCSEPTCGSTISELLEMENAQIQASQAPQDPDSYELSDFNSSVPSHTPQQPPWNETRVESSRKLCAVRGVFCPRWDAWQHPAMTVAARFTSEFYFSVIFPGTPSLENLFQLDVPARSHLLSLLLALLSPTHSPLLKLDYTASCPFVHLSN